MSNFSLTIVRSVLLSFNFGYSDFSERKDITRYLTLDIFDIQRKWRKLKPSMIKNHSDKNSR